MSDYYRLVGTDVVKCRDVLEWGQWFENADRIVKQEWIGDVFVSTVFLGIDYSFGGAKPLLFETMAFGGTYNDELPNYTRRSSTWSEAQLIHNLICLDILQRMSALRWGFAPFTRRLRPLVRRMRSTWASWSERFSDFVMRTRNFVKRWSSTFSSWL